MITEGHAAVLAQALGRLLVAREPGTVAYLRCLSSETVDGLAAEPVFEVPGFAFRAVVDREDATPRDLPSSLVQHRTSFICWCVRDTPT